MRAVREFVPTHTAQRPAPHHPHTAQRLTQRYCIFQRHTGSLRHICATGWAESPTSVMRFVPHFAPVHGQRLTSVAMKSVYPTSARTGVNPFKVREHFLFTTILTPHSSCWRLWNVTTRLYCLPRAKGNAPSDNAAPPTVPVRYAQIFRHIGTIDNRTVDNMSVTRGASPNKLWRTTDFTPSHQSEYRRSSYCRDRQTR